MQDSKTILGIVDMRLSGRTYAEVQARHSIGSSTVTSVMGKFNALGIPLEELKAMEPREVMEMFYPSEQRRRKKVPLPDFEKIHARMVSLGRHADLSLIWYDYIQENPEGYQLSQFYKYYGDYLKESGLKTKASMAVERVPGEKLFVDWAGDRPELLVDADSGELLRIHLFITTMGFSSKVYAEAFLDEKTASFVAGTVHALHFYGAVPAKIVPDNCRTAVTKHTKDELMLSSAYQDIEDYYGTVVVPAPPLKPKGKPTVENAVRTIERHILGSLAHETFLSLAALNHKIACIVSDLNRRPFANKQDIRKSREEAFYAFDLPAMAPIPPRALSDCDYKVCLRLPDNYHVEYGGHYYSAPYQLLGQPVILKATMSEVLICDGSNRLIHTHPRLWETFPLYVTADEHMPPDHQFSKQANAKDGTDYRRWGASVGPDTGKVIDRILRSYRHEEQAYRSCMGLLQAAKGMSPAWVEEAASRCLESGKCNYSTFKAMLKGVANDADKKVRGTSLPSHDNIRGKDCYQ